MKEVFNYLQSNQDSFIEELKVLLRIPSISAMKNDESKAAMTSAAAFIAENLRKSGMNNVEVCQTGGNPVVYADWLNAPGKPTLLIYGHYDVQPPEPLDEWTSPAFEPEVRDGKIFGRGTSDDKGQAFIHLKVVEAFMKVKGELPVNVKFCIEGEEEIGSPNLAKFLEKHKAKLDCDAILVSDTEMMAPKQPSITYGLRGLTYLEVCVTSSKGDQHSGTFGGAIANPIQVLAEMLTKCKDAKTGKIKIPGFYEDVVPLSKKERAELAKLPYNDKKYTKELGAVKTFGEVGFTTIERTGSRPTFELNGIWGGYTGEGAKTVLPAKAQAKVSMRLVANQNPSKIAELFTKYFKSIAPDTVKVSVTLFENNGHPVLSPMDSDGMKAAAIAIKKVFRKDPFYTREGGSIPVVADFQRIFKVEVVLLGFGLPDDNLHAPNEKFDLNQFKYGLLTSAQFLQEFADIKG